MTTNRQRGSILIYAMLTMSAMLAMGLTLSGLFISKLRIASNARNSTVAIYIADSVVEQCLFAARMQADPAHMTFQEGGTYEVVGADDGEPEATITDDCMSLDSGLFHFRATGIYRGVRRTLEITQ